MARRLQKQTGEHWESDLLLIRSVRGSGPVLSRVIRESRHGSVFSLIEKGGPHAFQRVVGLWESGTGKNSLRARFTMPVCVRTVPSFRWIACRC